MSYFWYQTSIINPRSYVCGFCGNSLSSNDGFYKGKDAHGGGTHIEFIYICHHCLKPTFFDSSGRQTPGPRTGDEVSGIDDEKVNSLYNEARDSYAIKAYTATVLSCRKLLMHVAVSKGAKHGLNFIEYVEYLSDNNYIPPGSKEWVDHIRDKGNEANHEIVIMSEQEAKDLLSFSGMLLKLIYEFPNRINKIKHQTLKNKSKNGLSEPFVKRGHLSRQVKRISHICLSLQVSYV